MHLQELLPQQTANMNQIFNLPKKTVRKVEKFTQILKILNSHWLRWLHSPLQELKEGLRKVLFLLVKY